MGHWLEFWITDSVTDAVFYSTQWEVGAEECPPQLLLHTQRNNSKKTLVNEPVNKNMHNYASFKFYNIAKKMCYISVISFFPFIVVITVLSSS